MRTDFEQRAQEVHRAAWRTRSGAGEAAAPADAPHGQRVPAGFLLTMGSYLGSLAAARDLGRHGIPVVLADPERRTLTEHSRFITRTVRCPPLEQPAEWLQWLLEFGRREPGHVLYPTGDDLCWLVDQHQAAISRCFHLYQPEQGVLYEILNKRRLYAHCLAVGMDQPQQWSAQDALSECANVAYPVLVKPPMQAGLPANPKALVARDRAELQEALRQYQTRYPYRPEVLAQDPSLAQMMVQAFHAAAAEHIYSLAGFYAPERNIYLLRASEKVLQHPLRVGVGLCFESRPVHTPTAAKLRELMDRLQYRGAFEVEFIPVDGRFLLIDFNPRFYGQMAFEIARGIPMARLCCLAALGDWDGAEQLAAGARQWNHEARWCFRNAWMLKLFVTTHWLGGNLSAPMRRQWLDWSRSAACEDPLLAADDPLPARAFRRQTWLGLVRHPRSTLRKFFRR